jgi:hypothetical protein
MADTYDAYRGRLAEYQEKLRYVEGAAGLAVVVHGKPASVDLFDRPSTCGRVWTRLLTGMVMDALEAGPEGPPPGSADVPGMVTALREAPWTPTPAVGAGEEFRAELDGDRHASALTFGDTVVHASLVFAG